MTLRNLLFKHKDILVSYLLFFFLSFALLINTRSYWETGASDFVPLYSAASIVRAGHGANLYHYGTQTEAQKPYIHASELRNAPLLFNHSPYETILFIPLSLLSYRTAFLFWWTTNHLFFLSSLLLLADRLPRARQLIPGFVCSLVIFLPAHYAFANGQDTILTFFLLVLMFCSFEERKDFSAGIALSMTLYKPQFFFAIFPLLAPRISRRFALGTVVGALAAVLASFLLVGVSGLKSFLQFLIEFTQLPVSLSGADSALMANVRGVFYRAGTSSVLAVSVVSIVLLALALIATRNVKTEIRIAVALALSCIVSFHTLAHDLTILVIPFLIVMNQLSGVLIVGFRRISATIFSLAMIVSSALLINPVLTFVTILLFSFFICFDLARESATFSADQRVDIN